MTSINITPSDGAQQGWNRPVSPRVARTGIAMIVAAVAVLGYVSASFGSNSDTTGRDRPIVDVR